MDILAVISLLATASFLALWLSGRARTTPLQAETERLRTELGAAREDALSHREQVARLQAELAHVLTGEDEKLAMLEATKTQLSQQFAELSEVALRQSNQAFLELAETRLKTATTEAKGDLDQRRQAVERLVEPLAKSLEKVQEHIDVVEKSRVSAYAGLREQVDGIQRSSELLRTETAALVNALRAPQVRGRWGETQLRRVVEAAGMSEHCDFVEQESTTTEGGLLRPDLVVKLGGGKNIVVDSKVPFAAYLDAQEARDDETLRARRLKDHARHVRTHIDQLAAKEYFRQFEPTPEFVVMFIPGDVFLDAALKEDAGLQEYGFARNIVLATPSTLIAVLRTVAYAWKQEALAENARQVYELGRELLGRLATMGTHFAKLGGELKGAVAAYNQTVTSLESRVLVTARRVNEFQFVDDKKLEPPAQVDIIPQELSRPELVASVTDVLINLPDSSGRLWGMAAADAALAGMDAAQQRLGDVS